MICACTYTCTHTHHTCRFEFFNHSPVLGGQMRFEAEYDWGATRIIVCTGIVENLRVWLVEPQNGFFNRNAVYGWYDDEVSVAPQSCRSSSWTKAAFLIHCVSSICD